MKKIYSFILMALLFSTACSSIHGVSEQKPDTSNQSFVDIPFEKYTLPNGLDVILHEDKSLPVVHVNLWYHVGSKDDPKNIKGFAHLFEHMMFQGTKHEPREFLSVFKELGATGTNATTNTDRTNYFNTIPSENLEQLLRLEADRMGFMTEQLDEKQFVNQKNVVKNEFKQKMNSPYSEYQDIVSKIYPEDHPYKASVIGNMDQLEQSTLEDVKTFYKKYYSPNNASLVIAGNFDPAQTKTWVEKYFASIPPGEVLVREKKLPALPLTKSEEVVVEKAVSHEVLLFDWITPNQFSKENYALNFASSMLAGDDNSRLNKILIHDKQLAVSVEASIQSMELNSVFSIEVVLQKPGTADETKKIIFEEIEKLKKDGPTQEEITRVLNYLEYSFVTNLESLSSKANYLNTFNTFLGDPGYLKTIFTEQKNLTADFIKNTFRYWIADAHYLTTHFIPTKHSQTPNTIDRYKTPNASEQFELKIPKIEKTVLENGLEIYVSHQPELPKVLFSLQIKDGNVYENKEKAGVAYLTAETIGRGSQSYTFEETNKKLGALGAVFSHFGDKYDSSVHLSVLKNNLQDAFKIITDVVLNPTFPEDEIEKVKELKIADIDYVKTKSKSLIDKLFYKFYFSAGHPFTIDSEGTKESLKNISRDDILTEYKTYWRPNNASLIFVGDITLEEAKKMAENSFGSWAKSDLTPLPFEPAQLKKSTEIYLLNFPKSAQTSVRIAFPAPNRFNEDYTPLTLASDILGGSSTGRLFNNLREDKGYTYGAYSSYSAGHYLGTVLLYSEVQNDKVIESVNEMVKEVQSITSIQAPTKSEIEISKSNFKQSFISSMSTLSGVENSVSTVAEYNFPLDYFQNYIAQINNTTSENIKKAIEKTFPKNGYTIAIAGDAEKIKPLLKKLKFKHKVFEVDIDGNIITP